MNQPDGQPPVIPDLETEDPDALADTTSLDAGVSPRAAKSSAWRFVLEREHARGNLGKVSLARDLEFNNRLVAYKEIQDEYADSEFSRKRFLFEAEITGLLEHPSIVPVYSMGQDETGRPFYAMRFISGQPLSEAIGEYHAGDTPEQTINFQQLLARFVSACYAIAYAHSRGVLHRDLKPANIMLGEYGETLVVDWGLAKRLDGTSENEASVEELLPPSSHSPPKTHGHIGTLQYCSPEQALQQTIGKASDIYSLGATLYHLLTNRPPFQEEQFDRCLPLVLNGQFPPPSAVKSRVPAALEKICLKAMSLRPADRYASVDEMLEEIRRWFAGSDRAMAQVEALNGTNIVTVPTILDELEAFEHMVLPRLRALDQEPLREEHRLKVRLALLRFDNSVLEYLKEQLLQLDAQEFLVIRTELERHKEKLVPDLWPLALDLAGDDEQRFRAACALAAYDPDNADWQKIGDMVVDKLVTENLLLVGDWSEALEPASRWLVPPLKNVFLTTDRGRQAEQSVATSVLSSYLRDDPMALTELVLSGEPRQLTTLMETLEEHREEAIRLLRQEMGSSETPEAGDPARPRSERVREQPARRASNAAAALLRLKDTEGIWSQLEHSPDPRRRTYLIHLLAPIEVDPRLLIEQLQQPRQPVSVRRALLLSLGEYAAEVRHSEEGKQLLQRLVQDYRNDPDPGIHAAIEWLLRRWGCGEQLPPLTGTALPQLGKEPVWHLSPQGHTLTVIPGPVSCQIGSPEEELDREPHEVRHERQIGRSFAIAARPVTVEQFLRFAPDQPYCRISSPERDCPINQVSWFRAAAYCNWLSEQEGIPPQEWCYPAQEQIRPGLQPYPDYLSRTGYRLPTEAEWEYACRAGAATSRFYGEAQDLLPRYGWYLDNSQRHGWPVGLLKPNDLGLFDLYGNVMEWCQENHRYYKDMDPHRREMDSEDTTPVEAPHRRGLRGGSFNNGSWMCRSAYRHWYDPQIELTFVGFRVARTYR